MDPVVTVRATSVDHEEPIGTPRNSLVWSLHMTALAQPEGIGLEQFVMVGAVRGMAVAAILLDRRMLPQDGTAKLRMALVTGIVN